MTREKSILFIYGKGANKVSCTTAISTNRIQSGIMIINPGGFFEPPDIHSGDEIYYILEGQIAILDPATGQTITAEKGEMARIPKGVWHQSFNTGDENLEVLAFIAPLQWQEGDAQIPSEFTGKSAYYQGTAETMPKPITPQEKAAALSTIRPQEACHAIHGVTNHYLVSFFVSNDRIHVGTFMLPMSIRGDLESHRGDEILYVEKGCIAVEIYGPDHATEATVNDVFEVHDKQCLLIPEKMKHRYLNLSSHSTKVIFGIAPTL